MKMRFILITSILTGLLLMVSGPLNAQYVDLLWERVAHYPFANDASDISSYENHGLVNGANLTTDRNGKIGQAYSFDGLNDYILGGTLAETISSSVTVSCWIKTSGVQSYSHIVSKYDYAVDAGFILGIQNGLALWAGRVGSGLYIRLTSRSRIDDGQWHHLLGMIYGSTWSVYIDGALENQTEIEYRRTSLDCNMPVTIGMYNVGDDGNHRHFSGKIDEVILYGRPLNDCEIEVLFGENYMDER